MPRTGSHSSKRSKSTGIPAQAIRVNEEPAAELDFDQGLERGGRVGDPQPRGDEMFPPERVREAGMTAGSKPGGEQTADDASNDTLLDDNPSHTPADRRGREPEDTLLPERSAQDIGAGTGLDEAELAERDPVGHEEAQRLARKAAEHAADINFMEVHEAAAREAPGPGRKPARKAGPRGGGSAGRRPHRARPDHDAL